MHHVLLGYDAQRSFAHVSVKVPGLDERGQGYEASAVILFSCPSLNSSLAAARCEFLLRTIKFLTASEFVHTQQKPWREAILLLRCLNVFVSRTTFQQHESKKTYEFFR